jgi:hypothetical protein
MDKDQKPMILSVKHHRQTLFDIVALDVCGVTLPLRDTADRLGTEIKEIHI